MREVPILGRVAAGKPTLAAEHIETSLPLPAEWAKGGEVFLLKVKGDSMVPYLLPDDYVIVRSQPSAENGDVVVTLMGEEATVEEVFQEEGVHRIKPDNERWETLRIEEGFGRGPNPRKSDRSVPQMLIPALNFPIDELFSLWTASRSDLPGKILFRGREREGFAHTERDGWLGGD